MTNPIRAKAISPKVIVATAAALLVPGVLASLNYLITPQGQQLFASLPPVLVVGILAVATAGITFLTSYLKNDPARVDAPQPALADDSNTVAGEVADQPQAAHGTHDDKDGLRPHRHPTSDRVNGL